MSSLISYAQNFEDVMLWRALKHVENGFYIDIGAQDPVIDSVSLAFHEHGWTGIHVEPTPHYAQLLREQRPQDIVLEVAIGMGPDLISFFEIPDTGISTANADIAEQHRERGFAVRKITVPCIKLAALFETCGDREIHWMKVDVEGFEFEVLKSWGKAKSKPWIVVVESTLPLTQIESHQKWEMLLTKRGYLPVYFDGLNRYYLASERTDLKKAFGSPPNLFDGFVLTRNSWPWCTELKLQIQEVEQKLEAEKAASVVRHQTQEEGFGVLLEGYQAEATSQLVSQTAEYNEAHKRAEHLAALLQAREFELQQTLASSAHLESGLRDAQEKLIIANDKGEATGSQLARITEQFAQNVALLGSELSAQIARNVVLISDLNAEQIKAKENIARSGSELSAQIERNVVLNEELNAEQLKAKRANEALSATLSEASRSKDFYAQKEEAFDRTLAAEKDRNAVLEKQWRSEQARNARHEVDLAAYSETMLQQAEKISHNDTVFATELNGYRERVSALVLELSDAKTANENQAVAHSAFARTAEQALRQSAVHISELDKIVSQQTAHIAGAKEKYLANLRRHEQSIAAAKDKIAELEQQRHLSLTHSAAQEQLLGQHEQCNLALRADIERTKAAYTWRLTAPFRWAKSVLYGDEIPISLNIVSGPVISTPIAFKPRPASTTAASNEITMPSTESQREIFEPRVFAEVMFDPADSHESFISQTYKTLLGREPEPDGQAVYLHRLNDNVPRETIFREIQMSQEAKSRALVAELAHLTALDAQAANPDAQALLARRDKAFVVAAYRQLLKRNPDPSGYLSYLARLRAGVSKIQLLADMRDSTEGKLQAQSSPDSSGLDRLIRRHKREQMFFFGSIFKALSATTRTHSIENTLERVENQMFVMGEDNRERASQQTASARLANREACTLLDKKLSALNDETHTRLNDAESETSTLIDRKVEILEAEIRAQLIAISSNINERFNQVDSTLARQSVALQRKGLEGKLELLENTVRKDANVSAVYSELERALTLAKSGCDENFN